MSAPELSVDVGVVGEELPTEEELISRLMGMSEEERGRALRGVVYGGREVRLRRYAADPFLWMRELFPHVLTHEPAPWHEGMVREMCGVEGNMLVEAWRGSAKSKLSTLATLWGALHGRFHDKLLTSATGKSATRNLEMIRNELKGNRDLVSLYGQRMGEVDNEDRLVLKDGTSIEAKGSGGQVRGDRYDEIDFDDSERDDKEHSDVRTVDQRDKYKYWVDAVAWPTLKATGRVRVLFTPLPKSYWRTRADEIMEGRREDWRLIRVPAEHDGKSNWPSLWPMERLAARRAEIGKAAYDQEYLLKPHEDKARLFLPEAIRRFGDDDFPRQSRWKTVMAMDCAVSQKETADSTAIVVVMRALSGDAKDQFFVPEAVKGRWSVLEACERIFSTWNIYRPEYLCMAKKPLEMVFKQELTRFFNQRGASLSFRPMDEDVDKRRRAQVVVPLMEAGLVRIHCAAAKGLLIEMEDFTGIGDDYDDLVDAFVHALTALKEGFYRDEEFTEQDPFPVNRFMMSRMGTHAQGRYMRSAPPVRVPWGAS